MAPGLGPHRGPVGAAARLPHPPKGAVRAGLMGLGTIGGGMCGRLLDRGYEVVGFDVAQPAREAAVKAGARVVDSAAEVAAEVAVTVTSLPNSAIVAAAVTGPGGWLEGASPGDTVIETSTIEPAAIVALAARVAERGARV